MSSAVSRSLRFQPALGDRPSISVIVPVHNGGESFRRCLSSLLGSEQRPDEIIVVADGESDGAWRLAEQWGLTVIRVAEAEGPAAARNRGAAIAQGDILFFVDADVTIQPDTIGQVMTRFEQDPSIDALIGSYDDMPGARNFLSQYRNLLHHYTHQVSSPEASTFWGACGAIRRSVFWAVNGFDERYRLPCVEDIELGYRLKQAGYRIRLYKDIQVKHLKRWQPLSMIRTDFFCRALPWTELLLRDRQPMNDLNLQTANRLSVVCAFLSLTSVPLAWVQPWSLALALLALLGLWGLNGGLYQFFYRKRGVWFTGQAMVWHWLFYLYSGAAFALGLVRHTMGQQTAASSRPAQKPVTRPLVSLR